MSLLVPFYSHPSANPDPYAIPHVHVGAGRPCGRVALERVGAGRGRGTVGARSSDLGNAATGDVVGDGITDATEYR